MRGVHGAGSWEVPEEVYGEDLAVVRVEERGAGT